ncbi:MAG: hypothetical protein KF881_02970 [Acidobacteria bacterium]|nr:hypothetical protein [Acidobacteriota bacterium]
MNDRNRRYLESGQRCRQWIADNSALIPAGSLFETKTTQFTALVDDVENVAGEAAAFTGEGLSATDVKGSERLDMIELMTKIRNAARAAEPDHPGTRDRYRFSRTMSHQVLLATGRSFAEGGVDDLALLVSYGAPGSWPDHMTMACQEYEDSFGQQDSAVSSRIGKNAELSEKINQMTALKATIGHLVKNYCAGNTAALASWTAAAHVESPPKKKPPTP